MDNSPQRRFSFMESHPYFVKIHTDSSLNEKKDEIILVCIYPMSGDLDNSYFKQALNLFDKLVEKNAIGVIV